MEQPESAQDGQCHIVVLYCQYSANGDLPQSAPSGHSNGLRIRPVMLPCSSKAQVPYLLSVLDAGADGIEVVACPDGACRHLVGNCRAEKRIGYARRLLEEAGLDPERLGLTRRSGLASESLTEVASARAVALEASMTSPKQKGGDQ